MNWDHIIINVLFIVGLNKATYFEYAHPSEMDQDYVDGNGIISDSKFVLWWFRFKANRIFGHFLSKPLFTCIPCMASVWGTAGYWITHPFEVQSVWGWPVYVCVLAGIGTMVDKYIHGGHYQNAH